MRHANFVLGVLVALGGCTQNNTTACDDKNPCGAGQVCLQQACVPTPGEDMSMMPLPDDMAMTAKGDMTMPAKGDMTMPTPGDMTMPTPGDMTDIPGFKYASNSIKLPSSASPFAIDIDGDGKPDNQFKSIISAIGAVGFDVQTPVDDAVKAGVTVALVQVKTKDVMNAAAIDVLLNTAQPPGPGMPPPKYDGTDVFMAQPVSPAVLKGQITAGVLGTTPPPMLGPMDAARFSLVLPLGGGMLPLDLYGVHVQGTISASGIMSGQLHGVVRKMDIDAQIIPAIASLLTSYINMNPTSTTAKTIITLFEDPTNPVSQMKCMIPAQCCATSPSTCVILPAEVKANPLIANLLAPDVQVFDGTNWKPVPHGTMKDALSFGIGFTGVKASF